MSDFKEKFDHLEEEVKEKAAHLREDVDHKVDDLKADIEEDKLGREIKKDYNEVAGRVDLAADDIKDKVETFVEEH